MTRYFLIGSDPDFNLAKVEDHDYSYLNRETGEWVRDPAGFDKLKSDAIEVTSLAAYYLKNLFSAWGLPAKRPPEVA